jgi:hypothetical protein
MISDVQHDFNQAYPFLKIEFYKMPDVNTRINIKKHLKDSNTIGTAGLLKEGHLEITDAMTVGELEKTLREIFGLSVQVSRKSGSIWLETTMTNSLTLKQQTEHGRELAEPLKKTLQDEIDPD